MAKERLPTVALTPTARPTDQFAPGEVRAKAAGGELLSLAQSLSGIAPELNGVIQRQFRFEVEQSRLQAMKDSAGDRFANMKALKAAVERGEVAESNNPWYMVALKQEIARKEGHAAATHAVNEYYRLGLQNQESLEAVEKHADAHLAPLVEGRDVWQMEVLAPQLEQAKAAIMQRHVSERTKLREDEREASFGTVNRTIADGYDPERDDDTVLSQVRSRLQAELDRAGDTIHWTKANRWISEAVAASALEKRDVRVARNLLAGLRTKDGASLADTAENKVMLERLGREIHNRRMEDLREGSEANRLAVEKEKIALVQTMRGEAEKQGVPWYKVELTAEQLKGHPEAVNAFIQLQTQYNTQKQANEGVERNQKAKEISIPLYRDAISGTLTEQTRVKGLDALASIGALGEADEFNRFKYYLEQDDDKIETEPGLYVELRLAAEEGRLTTQALTNHRQEKRLSKNDFSRLSEMVIGGKGRGGGSGGNLADDRKLLETLIAAPKMDGTHPNAWTSPEARRLDATHTLNVEKANEAYARELDDLMQSPRWVKASSDEQKRLRSELLDSVSTTYSGTTQAKLLSARPRSETVPQLPVPPPKTAVAGPAAPGIAAATKKPDGTVGEASPFIDPVAAPLSSDEKAGLKDALRVEPGMTLEQAFQWSEHLDADLTAGPPAPRTPQLWQQASEDAFWAKLSRTALWRPGPPDKKYDGLQPPTTADEKHDWDEMKNEIARRDRAVAAIEKLRPVVADAKVQSDALVEKSRTAPLTPSEQRTLRQLTVMRATYADVRRTVGYTVGEVKAMGEDGWRHAPMFANNRDLFERGGKIASELGLARFQLDAFITTQRRLIDEMRSN